MLWRTKLKAGLLGEIHPDGSQSTPVEYQGQFALLVREKEHRTCLIYKASSRCGYCIYGDIWAYVWVIKEIIYIGIINVTSYMRLFCL